MWNVLLANLRSLDVVGSLKHDLYPQGFTGVVLLLDGHVAAQYTPGLVNVTICSNSGALDHEKLRATLWVAFDELEP